MPEGFLCLHILLAANMAILPQHRCSTIQAIFLFSLRDMRQSKIFLKNKYKKIQEAFLFPVNEQFW